MKAYNCSEHFGKYIIDAFPEVQQNSCEKCQIVSEALSTIQMIEPPYEDKILQHSYAIEIDPYNFFLYYRRAYIYQLNISKLLLGIFYQQQGQ